MFSFSNRNSHRTAGKIATLSMKKVTQQALNPQEDFSDHNVSFYSTSHIPLAFHIQLCLHSHCPLIFVTDSVLQSIFFWDALFLVCSFFILYHLSTLYLISQGNEKDSKFTHLVKKTASPLY